LPAHAQFPNRSIPYHHETSTLIARTDAAERGPAGIG
jgi:hypothetical protein